MHLDLFCSMLARESRWGRLWCGWCRRSETGGRRSAPASRWSRWRPDCECWADNSCCGSREPSPALPKPLMTGVLARMPCHGGGRWNLKYPAGVTVMRLVPAGATPRMLVPVTTTCSTDFAGWTGWAEAMEAAPCTTAMIANTELPRFSELEILHSIPLDPPRTTLSAWTFCACTGRRSRQGPHRRAELIFRATRTKQRRKRGPAMLARVPRLRRKRSVQGGRRPATEPKRRIWRPPFR